LTEKQKNQLKELVQKTVEEFAWFDDDRTNPGIVLFTEQPSYEIYQKTVHSLVTIQETENVLTDQAYWFSQYKNKRGLIGATAAVAWRPLQDFTYELITYREKTRWGTDREVDDTSVQSIDKHTTKTFDNYDYTHHHNRIVPHSPCPILFGIRGDDHEELFAAMKLVKAEPRAGWLLFQTNQGTDNHLQPCTIEEIQPYYSVQVEGIVDTQPHTIAGGHVLFSIRDATGTIDCAAYEPTKEFRNRIRCLQPGDTVSVCGGVRKVPLTVNIEKIQVLHLQHIKEKIENPVCPLCGKHMKSRGKDQGFKCVNCKTTSQQPVMSDLKREVKEGWYEVPVCARRHLSKPLKRMKKENVVIETV